MGGGSWSNHLYNTSTKIRSAAGLDDFGYDTEVKSGRASGIHETLDPSKMTGPRESRDSDEHPESLPVAVIFDVTGSMHQIPKTLQTKLASIMDVVIEKAEVPHPQILVGAVGDSTCDRYPLQIGQFESDNRFDDQLRNIILERGGGGQDMESYALAYYFAAYHTESDSIDKRGKRGYLFTMGDEKPWPTLPSAEIKKVFGDVVAEPIEETVEALIEKASEKFNIYHLFSLDGSYSHSTEIHDRWRELLGERLIMVEDSSLIAEIISGVIHMQESAYDIDRVIDDIGVTGDARKAVENALVPLAGSNLTTSGTGTLPEAHGA